MARQKSPLDKLQKDIDRLQAKLVKMQEKLRVNPNDADLRQTVQDTKAKLVPLLDQKADLQREESRLAGGRQFTVEP